jgi:sentrin-specific protease 1
MSVLSSDETKVSQGGVNNGSLFCFDRFNACLLQLKQAKPVSDFGEIISVWRNLMDAPNVEKNNNKKKEECDECGELKKEDDRTIDDGDGNVSRDREDDGNGNIAKIPGGGVLLGNDRNKDGGGPGGDEVREAEVMEGRNDDETKTTVHGNAGNACDESEDDDEDDEDEDPCDDKATTELKNKKLSGSEIVVDIDQLHDDARRYPDMELTTEQEATVRKILLGQIVLLSYPKKCVIPQYMRLIQPGSRDYPPSYVVDHQTIEPGWLSGDIIDSYLQIVSSHYSTADDKKGVLSYLFWDKHMEPGAENGPDDGDIKRVAKWGDKLAGRAGLKNLFDFSLIIIPTNQTRFHWGCTVVNMKRKVILSYDPMSDDRFPVSMSRKFLKYLGEEHHRAFGTKLPKGWKILREPHGINGVPTQNNGYDCGVFSAMFGHYMMAGWPLIFTQRDMPSFRRKITLTIYNQEVLC